jgi:hypothetical protein
VDYRGNSRLNKILWYNKKAHVMVNFGKLKKLATAGARLAVKKGIAAAGGAEGIQSSVQAALAPRVVAAVNRVAGMKRGGVVVVRVPAKKKRAVRRRRA